MDKSKVTRYFMAHGVGSFTFINAKKDFPLKIAEITARPSACLTKIKFKKKQCKRYS